MNFKNYTIKSQEAIQKASEIAMGNQQQGIDTGHLLKGMFEVDENVLSFIFNKLGANLEHVKNVTDKIVEGYPKVTGGDPYLSQNETVLFKRQILI